MNLNDFSKWLQYNKVQNLRGSEYFPYPLYVKYLKLESLKYIREFHTPVCYCGVVMHGWRLYPRALRLTRGSGNKKSAF